MTPQPLSDEQVVVSSWSTKDDVVVSTTSTITTTNPATDKTAALVSKFAQAHMAKLGWTPGSGLGKRRDGRSTHIQVRKREEGLGLGASTVAAVATTDEWWKDSLGNVLAQLNAANENTSTTKKKKKSKKNKDPSRRVTDEELFQATGGARFGMRAQRRAEGKWRRTESMESTGTNITSMTTTSAVTTTTTNTTTASNTKISTEGAGLSVLPATTTAKSEKSKRKREKDEKAIKEEVSEKSSRKKQRKEKKEKTESRKKTRQESPE